MNALQNTSLSAAILKLFVSNHANQVKILFENVSHGPPFFFLFARYRRTGISTSESFCFLSLFKGLFAAERESPSAAAYRHLRVEAAGDKQTQSSPRAF